MTRSKSPRTRKPERNRRHEAFVAQYAGPGTGVATARAVGFRGTDASVAVTASRLLTRPEIRSAIEDRGVSLPQSQSPPARGPGLDTSSPTAFYRSVAASTTLPLRDRQRAMERLEAADGKSAGTGEELLAALQAKVQDVLRERMDAAGVARRVRAMVRHATDPALLEAVGRWLLEVEELAGERDAA